MDEFYASAHIFHPFLIVKALGGKKRVQDINVAVKGSNDIKEIII